MMGYEDFKRVNSKVNNVLDECIHVAKKCSPTIIYRKSKVNIADNKLILNKKYSFNSNNLVEKFKNCDQVITSVMTAGRETEELIKEYSQIGALEGYIMDTVASYIIEKLSEEFWNETRKKYNKNGKNITNCVSPGNNDFPLSEQKVIFNYLQPNKIGVSISDSYVIEPIKSLSLLIGVGEEITQAQKAHDCNDCDMEDCFLKGVIH